MTTLKDAIHNALARPEAERLVLIERLIESIEEPVEPEVRAAWDAILSERLATLEAGTVQLEDWAEVKQRVAERLGQSG